MDLWTNVGTLISIDGSDLDIQMSSSDRTDSDSDDEHFVKVDTEYKNEIKWIIPNAQKNTMEPIYLTLEAGGSTCPDTPHEGEEFGYILQWTVSIHLGNKTYKAKKGESFYYTADKTHFLSSKSGAVLIWVSSPPSF